MQIKILLSILVMVLYGTNLSCEKHEYEHDEGDEDHSEHHDRREEHDEHDGHEHEHGEKVAVDAAVMAEINASYQELLPLFRKACFDCHSEKPRYPWYAKLPLVSQLIRHDIKEAREHLLMGESLPFKHQKNLLKDLEEIAEVMEEGEMPPLKYQIMHWDAFLSKEEKKSILSWAENSGRRIKDQASGGGM